MRPGPSLPQNVHRLIRVHHTMNENGALTKQSALLDQLENATTTTGNDGGRSNEPRLPINAAAIDLQIEIREQVKETEQHRTGSTMPTRAALAAWATEERDDWSAYLAALTNNLCDRINQLINPKPRARQLHIPCPSCGTKYAGEERKPALHAEVYHPDGTMKHPNDYQVHCTECEAEWEGKEISWLNTAQDAKA